MNCQACQVERAARFHAVCSPWTTLSHRYLLEQVWGEQYRNEIQYLKVFIQRLRQKLGDDPQTPRYIHTERGVGYRFMLQR